jgi:hypothetical protein
LPRKTKKPKPAEATFTARTAHDQWGYQHNIKDDISFLIFFSSGSNHPDEQISSPINAEAGIMNYMKQPKQCEQQTCKKNDLYISLNTRIAGQDTDTFSG